MEPNATSLSSGHDAKIPISSGDPLQEDLSCNDVNQAIIKTWNSPWVLDVTYNVKADGTLKPHSEFRAVEAYQYEKFAFSDKWRSSRRGTMGTIGQRGPFWNSCKFIGTESDAGEALRRYSAIWRSFPYEAPADIWISNVDGRLRKIQRRYPDKLWQYPFSTALDMFNYDPAQATAPSR